MFNRIASMVSFRSWRDFGLGECDAASGPSECDADSGPSCDAVCSPSSTLWLPSLSVSTPSSVCRFDPFNDLADDGDGGLAEGALTAVDDEAIGALRDSAIFALLIVFA